MEGFQMKDCNCGYCMRGELLDKFGIEICDLEVSQLIQYPQLQSFIFNPPIDYVILCIYITLQELVCPPLRCG